MLLCLLIFGIAVYILLEIFEAERRIWGDPEWRLDEPESHDVTPFLAIWRRK